MNDSRSLADTSRSFWAAKRGKLRTNPESKVNDVRDLISNLLRSNSLFTPVGMPKTLTSTVDCISLAFKDPEGAELRVDDMVAKMATLRKVFEGKQSQDLLKVDEKVFFHPTELCRACFLLGPTKYGDDQWKYGWNYEGYVLSVEHDNVIDRALVVVENIIFEQKLNLTVERVYTRPVDFLRATYFFKAPAGAIHYEKSQSVPPVDYHWYQCFADEFMRQFPDSHVAKDPIVLHPQHGLKSRKKNASNGKQEEPSQELQDVYFVAVVYFEKAGQHLHDVDFNIKPVGGVSPPTGAVSAHLATGDQVCSHCLCNGHVKSQCRDIGKPQKSRASTIEPHVYSSCS